jgi:hypothetical protein
MLYNTMSCISKIVRKCKAFIEFDECKDKFWYQPSKEGKDWKYIPGLADREIYKIQATLEEDGYKSPKIDREIDKRNLYSRTNLSYEKILQINDCYKINKDTDINTIIGSEFDFDD